MSGQKRPRPVTIPRRRWRSVRFGPEGPTIKRARGSDGEPVEVMVNGGGRNRTRLRQMRRRGKSRRSTRRYRRIPSTLGPFSIARKLKSVFTYSLAPPAGGGIKVETMKLNSIFDPTGAFGSFKPLGHAQYAALYNRYCVIGYSLKFEVCTAENSTPTMVGFCPIVSGTTLAEYPHYKEVPGCVSMMLTPDVDKGTFTARSGTRRFLLPGGGKMLADDELTAAVSSDPTRILHGHVFAQAADQSSTAAAVRIVVTMWQTVVFFVPVIPARST